MAQTISTEMISLNVQKLLDSAQEQSTQSAQQLSSGLRVNSAQDGAAGLGIAERMNSQLRDMNVGMRNAQDGISMSRTAEGGLKQVNDLLQKMRELALQSSNGSYSDTDRENLNKQFSALNSDIARVASSTTFNDKNLLANDGATLSFSLGSGVEGEEAIDVDLVGVASLTTDISTYESSLESISNIDSMMASVSSSQADFGAVQNRFESAIENLQTGIVNQSSAHSRIVDADYAVAAANLAGSQIMQQAGTAMSVQANVSRQSAMQLLG